MAKMKSVYSFKDGNFDAEIAAETKNKAIEIFHNYTGVSEDFIKSHMSVKRLGRYDPNRDTLKKWLEPDGIYDAETEGNI